MAWKKNFTEADKAAWKEAQQNKAADLKASILKAVEQLAAETDGANLEALLETAGRFHHYSAWNVLMILMQRPNATYVASFKRWQELKRQVKKGEHGIEIFVPVTFAKPVTHMLVADDGSEQETTERERAIRFKIGHVFDISQTDGEALPPNPDDAFFASVQGKDGCDADALLAKLLAVAESNGYHVEFKPTDSFGRSTRGYITDSGAIAINENETTLTKCGILAHELAHGVLCHLKNWTSREEAELEAEAAAYVIMAAAGAKKVGAPNYLKHWGADAKSIMAHLSSVTKAAHAVIISMA